MKRITILFDNEAIYREMKAEAAKEGRPVKDLVAEVLTDWLRRRPKVSPEVTARRSEALRLSKELLEGMPVREGVILETLDEIREGRVR